MESFGAKLKREREKKGVTLEDISRDTKIGARMLRALEEDHFDQLPGGIFNKGFVRAYARRIGLDEEQAIADYLEASGETPPPAGAQPLQETFPLEVREDIKRPQSEPVQIPWRTAGLILLIAVLSFAAWSLYSREKHAPKSLAASASQSASTAGQSGSQLNRTIARPFTVSLKATDDCWIAVTADGKEVLQDTLIAPAQKSFAARQRLAIRAGNVGALDVSFNGKPLPSQGDFGEVKTLTFGPDGLEPPPKPANPETNTSKPE